MFAARKQLPRSMKWPWAPNCREIAKFTHDSFTQIDNSQIYTHSGPGTMALVLDEKCQILCATNCRIFIKARARLGFHSMPSAEHIKRPRLERMRRTPRTMQRHLRKQRAHVEAADLCAHVFRLYTVILYLCVLLQESIHELCVFVCECSVCVCFVFFRKFHGDWRNSKKTKLKLTNFSVVRKRDRWSRNKSEWKYGS